MKEPIFCMFFVIRLTYHCINRAFYVTYLVHLNIEFMSFDILLFLGNCVFHFSLISSFLSNFRFPTEKGMTSWWNSNLFVEFTAFRNPLDHESIAVTQSLISHKKTKGMQISRKKKSNICFCKNKRKVENIVPWRKPFQSLHGHDRYYLQNHKKTSIRVAMIIIEGLFLILDTL